MQEVEKLRAQAASGDHKAAGKVPEAERALADKDAALKGELGNGWATCFERCGASLRLYVTEAPL